MIFKILFDVFLHVSTHLYIRSFKVYLFTYFVDLSYWDKRSIMDRNLKENEAQSARAESIHKGVNQYTRELIDELRTSRGLHSVSAYGQSRHAFVGVTVNT